LVRKVSLEIVPRWENVVNQDHRDHRVNRDPLEALELLD
jgi:hypothetical protein